MTRVAIERNQKDNVITVRGYPEQVGDSAYFCFVVRLFLPDGVTMTDDELTKLWQKEFEVPNYNIQKAVDDMTSPEQE